MCRLALRGAVEEGEPRAAVSRLSLPAWCIGPIRSTCTDGRSNFRQLRGVCRRQRQLASGAATAWQRPISDTPSLLRRSQLPNLCGQHGTQRSNSTHPSGRHKAAEGRLDWATACLQRLRQAVQAALEILGAR